MSDLNRQPPLRIVITLKDVTPLERGRGRGVATVLGLWCVVYALAARSVHPRCMSATASVPGALQVIDMGCAAFCPLGGDKKLKDRLGSPHYIPPEVSQMLEATRCEPVLQVHFYGDWRE